VRSIRQAAYSDIASIETPDDHTIVVTLSAPNAAMLAQFASPWDCIYSAEKLEEDPRWPEQNVMGTGPFTFVEHSAGSHWIGERFDDYWGPRARVPRLRFAAYEDDSLAYFDLLSDDLHYAPVPMNRSRDARRRFGDDGFVLETGLAFYGFNLRSPKVQSPDLRAGLSRAIDRAAIAGGVYEDTREPAHGIASPALPGADEDAWRGWVEEGGG
ncbi:MAG: hypothetical protein KY453_09415, partial [Gemmatimonadetes bacterium]|nr:hypothetical protein [Gemmatimonadota bacterium]